jgi:magnesium transporter
MSTPESRLPVPARLAALADALHAGDDAQVALLLDSLHPAEIAGFLESLPGEERQGLWDALPRERHAGVLAELSQGVRQRVVADLPLDDLLAITERLDPDDVADLVGSLPDVRVEELLGALDSQDRARLEQMLAYPEDTAGGLMTPDAVTVRPDITVEVVLRYLRRRGRMPDATDKLVVVDRRDRFLGEVTLTALLTAHPEQTIAEIVNRDAPALAVSTPASEVAQTFARRDLISAPVVDAHGRFLGRITIDDVVDVLRAQAEESFLGMAGVRTDEDLFAPVLHSARQRAVWLGVNLVTALLAAAVIRAFEGSIERMVALAALMPVIASMGGNAGNQTVALVIRALALGQVSRRNAWTLLRREVQVGLLNSAFWGSAIALVAGVWFGAAALGFTAGLAMVINLITAAAAGFLIPVTLRRLGVDPAVASTVFLTTATDVVGFLAFLGLATLILL